MKTPRKGAGSLHVNSEEEVVEIPVCKITPVNIPENVVPTPLSTPFTGLLKVQGKTIPVHIGREGEEAVVDPVEERAAEDEFPPDFF